MKIKLKQFAGLAVGLYGAFFIASSLAVASSDHSKHGTDAKVVACHEAHEQMMAGKMSADHMKGCHDKDGKLIGNADGHMGKDMKMPHGDHMMGNHKMDDHMMDGMKKK